MSLWEIPFASSSTPGGVPRIVDSSCVLLLVLVVRFLDRYDQATEAPLAAGLIIDREGMAAEFLASLVKAGRTVVTILQSEQYKGLASFSEVTPLPRSSRQRDARSSPGSLCPEAAGSSRGDPAASRGPDPRPPPPHAHPLPARRGYLSRPVGCGSGSDTEAPGWVTTPMSAAPTEPKLIPIVTTAADLYAVEPAQTYTHHWPAQENSFRDYLLALGLDTNHGR
jgi:hypothetical protein